MQTEKQNLKTSMPVSLFLPDLLLLPLRAWLAPGGQKQESLIPTKGHRIVCPGMVMASRSHKGATMIHLGDSESSILLFL